jgi:hypothetical protein
MALPIRRATPQPRIQSTRSHRVVPAPLASPQAKAVFAKQVFRAWILRPSRSTSRRVVPAPFVAAVTPPSTLARQGAKRFLVRPLIQGSRLVRPAPLASPQAKAVFAKTPYRAWILRPTRSTSRRVIPAPIVSAVNPPSTNVLGIKRGPVRVLRSHLVSPAPLASPQAKSVFARTPYRAWLPRPRISASRRITPAPSVAVGPVAATFALQGVKRPTGKPSKARVVLAPLASPQAKATNVSGIRRGPTKNNHSRFVVGIAAIIPAVPATIARQGVRRVHPKRPPVTRLFVAATPSFLPGAGTVSSPTYASSGGRAGATSTGRDNATAGGRDSVIGPAGRDSASSGGTSKAT